MVEQNASGHDPHVNADTLNRLLVLGQRTVRANGQKDDPAA
jgi:hypothetical protein